MIESGKAGRDTIRDMKLSMTKLEENITRGREQLRLLRPSATTDKHLKSYEKIDKKLQKEIDTYYRTKQKYEFLANDKNAVAKGNNLKDSYSNTGSFAGSDHDIAVMKVYDQSDFIDKRHDKIVRLNQ